MASQGDLVFVHRGYSWYVPYAVSAAIKKSGMRVHYVGDQFGCHVAKALGARVYRYADYSARAHEFGRVYRHYSSLGEEFERFCIERWFALLAFAEANGLESLVYSDTDILVTDGLGPYVEKTTAFDMMFDGGSGHLCMVNRLASLAQFCEFVVETYRSDENVPRMQAVLEEKAASLGAGGVSDMTMFQWFHAENRETVGVYDDVFGVSPFDGSLGDFTGFEADEAGFKDLSWEGTVPYATLSSGKKVQFATLHHQGRAKVLLKENARRLGISSPAWNLSASMLDLGYRTARKTRRLLGQGVSQ